LFLPPLLSRIAAHSLHHFPLRLQGVILGPLVVFFFGFIMNMTKDFMLETMARAEALSQAEEICERAIRDSSSGTSSAASGSAGGKDAGSSSSPKPSGTATLAVAPSESEYLVSSVRKFEVTDLFAIFLGTRARTVSSSDRRDRCLLCPSTSTC
jgi:hypothetical protein